MVMEIKGKGNMPRILSSTFIDIIHKVDNFDTFGDFMTISLCNILYKIVANILSLRLNPLLSKYVFEEQFVFLKNKHIHEVVGFSQETFHSIKNKYFNSFVLKIDLEKEYDKVSWTFLHLLLIYLGFSYNSTKWIVSCVTSTQFSMLINGAARVFLIF